ncbi:energy transducer TonB [Methylobacterium nigriterrae]|uniref:energy transducer TonB n=1 Tax=Methylobacterium nigriterrae TaxID=3127512 RepID=UPI003013F81B
MPLRLALLTGCLCLSLTLLGLVGTGEAAAPVSVQRWLSSVVAKIEAADRSRAARQQNGRSVAVDVRVRVAEDGSVLAMEVERSSGTRSLDERAIAAIKAAGPFTAPPAQMLLPNGTTELSFPLALPGRR